MDVKHVQAVQTNHADRLLRLEKRQADDAALKSVWGAGSPFPGVLSGTPQHGPVHNSPTDVFDDFDDEQGQNLLGSLHLEADEEPVRRGASRANSVRFDVSALQGSHWAQARSSGEFAPVRPSSGFGSHPMTERSLSHKSDGRHSSAGHSVHSAHSAPSGRTSSLGLDTNFLIGDPDDDSALDMPDPPPGLFVLGTVPSIIRCWLTVNFSHNALLYADICTGSQKSILEYSLVKELGLVDQVRKDPASSSYIIRLPVYLPEAIITQPTSRSNSPAPQLPTLTADFHVVGMNQRSATDRKKTIRVFLGSDTLRAHNADILFSQNLMTLYGDDRNKLSVPFVRPEDENSFKHICTSNVPPEKNELKATAIPFTPSEQRPKNDTPNKGSPSDTGTPSNEKIKLPGLDIQPESTAATLNNSSAVSTSPIHSPHPTSDSEAGIKANGSITDSEKLHTPASSVTEAGRADATNAAESTKPSMGTWGSWRQGSTPISSENNGDSPNGYQRAVRGGRSMKVLKPSKSLTSTSTTTPGRSTSGAKTGAAYEPAPLRSTMGGELPRRKSQVNGVENQQPPLRWEPKRVGSEEQKSARTIATISRSSNPVGGASAFAWMNPNKPKATTTADS
ncbi:ubiquitin carboxyl-terminal hydrolase 19 protein [Rutstroemia sp. NJR-2017a WRK4]|nr:ubiquitin carboxyl-terminal hydrolase 19 protein [Rutstroemia sp. NJR-2017a WRK4]PQE30012.1 ubiquitin carboxyl-terminal hydrolase 19 protein [Rutstroemia sp. NJR-2017a WRK4]